MDTLGGTVGRGIGGFGVNGRGGGNAEIGIGNADGSRTAGKPAPGKTRSKAKQ